MQKVARYVSFGFSTHGPISAATPKPATVAWLQLSASTMVLQVHTIDLHEIRSIFWQAKRT